MKKKAAKRKLNISFSEKGMIDYSMIARAMVLMMKKEVSADGKKD